MARPRRTKTASSATATGEFTCPECGNTFTRAASLGAHRNRAHGITGTSKRARKRTSAPTSGSTTPRRRARQPARRSATRSARVPTTSRQNGAATINRDQLLQTLFPNGVPPREDVIQRIGNWLDEAEQLANL